MVAFRKRNLTPEVLHQFVLSHCGIYLAEKNSVIQVDFVDPGALRGWSEDQQRIFLQGYQKFIQYILEQTQLSTLLEERYKYADLEWESVEAMAATIREQLVCFEQRVARSYEDVLEGFLVAELHPAQR
ncbi:MAG: hypothetical protein A2201_11870 [Alicyclobacillus sp. RIFOXYA1_FULL_53_8]|nr:MAG: hypothetical protein A2201_11870 [Alicyclobacillus sp. RIFOXYA1_FULL_53_8]